MKIMSPNYAITRCSPISLEAHYKPLRDVWLRNLLDNFYEHNQEITMAWTTPAATDLRFGFEITMYIANR